MPLFSKRKDLRVQTFILNLVNNNCPELKALIEGPRSDRRVNLVVVVMVIPLEKKRPQPGRAFNAVTKEFSITGVAIVCDQPYRIEEAVLGFLHEGEMVFLRAVAKHVSAMGGGFFQIGFKLIEPVSPADYPELASLRF